MMQITIGETSVDFNFDKEKGLLYRDHELVSDEELKEFETEILQKRIVDATDDELNECIVSMGEELDLWYTKYRHA